MIYRLTDYIVIMTVLSSLSVKSLYW